MPSRGGSTLGKGRAATPPAFVLEMLRDREQTGSELIMTAPSLDGRRFRDVSEEPNGHVGTGTVFEYHQDGTSFGLATQAATSSLVFSWVHDMQTAWISATPTSPRMVKPQAVVARAPSMNSPTVDSNAMRRGSGRAAPVRRERPVSDSPAYGRGEECADSVRWDVRAVT